MRALHSDQLAYSDCDSMCAMPTPTPAAVVQQREVYLHLHAAADLKVGGETVPMAAMDLLPSQALSTESDVLLHL